MIFNILTPSIYNLKLEQDYYNPNDNKSLERKQDFSFPYILLDSREIY